MKLNFNKVHHDLYSWGVKWHGRGNLLQMWIDSRKNSKIKASVLVNANPLMVAAWNNSGRNYFLHFFFCVLFWHSQWLPSHPRSVRTLCWLSKFLHHWMTFKLNKRNRIPIAKKKCTILEWDDGSIGTGKDFCVCWQLPSNAISLWGLGIGKDGKAQFRMSAGSPGPFLYFRHWWNKKSPDECGNYSQEEEPGFASLERRELLLYWLVWLAQSETQSLSASQKTQGSYQETTEINKMPHCGTWYHNTPWKIKKIWAVLQRLILLLMQIQHLIQDMPTQ